MYQFLDHLQVTESDRLVMRNIKLKDNPLGGLMDSALGQKRSKSKKKNKKQDSSDESEGEAQVPIGFDYTENFPALPDQDGKGRKAR